MKRGNKNYTICNEIKLIRNGESFLENYLNTIQSATKHILLHTYIFEYDNSTRIIIDLLKQKAKAGIEIYIILDAFGSKDFPQEIEEELFQAGIHFKYFSPLMAMFKYHIGRRLHSKVLLVDGRRAVVGGINLGETHFSAINGGEPWLDYAVYINGEEVKRLFKKIAPLYHQSFSKFPRMFLPYHVTTNPQHQFMLRSVVNDWMRFRNEIFRGHLEAIKTAKKQIIILGTYFLPSKKMLRKLKEASERGVLVKIIFSTQSDVPLEKLASQYLYSWYLEHKFEIYQWNKSNIHGKLMLIDDTWTSIGSFNHNFISHYANHELNIDIYDRDFSKEVLNELAHIISESEPLTVDIWNKRNHLFHKILRTLIYLFSSILFLVSYLTIQRKLEKENITEE